VTYKEACGKKCELGADSLTNTSSESEEMERKMPDNGGASKYCFQVDKSKSDSGTFCLNSLTSHHVKNKMDNFFDMSFKAFHICLLFLSNLSSGSICSSHSCVLCVLSMSQSHSCLRTFVFPAPSADTFSLSLCGPCFAIFA
jgi:hypothetical protein